MKREEAIKVVRNIYQTDAEKEALETLIPELRESEDERIIKTLQEYVKNRNWNLGGPTQDEVLAWLERQKEQKEELVYHLNGLMQDYIKEGKDDEEKEHRLKCYQLFWDALEDTNFFEQKEQKPVKRSEEDERIRRWILEYFYLHRYELRGASVSDMDILSWLERHKEPTATMNGEPIPTENHSVDIPLAEWSEEDSDNLERVDNYLWMLDNYVGDDCAMPQGKTDKIRGNIQGILSPWLKSLPERFNLQPKPAWSEKDKEWLSEVYFAIDHSMYSNDERQAMKNYIDSLRKDRKTCDVDEFSLTLRNCLSTDSELTKEQADTFARAYGEDLYKVALGEIKTGLDRYDIAEYKDSKRERFLVRCKSGDMFFRVGDIRLAYKAYEPSTGYFVYFDESKGSDVKSYDPWKFSKHFEIIENEDEVEFNPKPGEKFWVRCKTNKTENLWFDKDDERPAYAVTDPSGIITYIVHIKKDGTGNCVSYQNKEKFLETFEIVDGKTVEQWPNLSNCKHDCKTCFARCLYRKERNPEQ